jgi:HPr kinase/phosphorylase
MEQKYTVKLSTLAEQIKLEHIYTSTDFEKILIGVSDVHRPGLQLAGFYDYFEPKRIQLMGNMETAYLNNFEADEKLAKFEKLFSKKIPAIIICHGADVMDECVEMAAKYDVTVFRTERGTSYMMALLIGTLNEALAPRLTRHGVLVEVYGEGVLLLGESGVGKSEAAIELLKRGHRLIADDAVEIKRVGQNMLIGNAPELIRHYVELRGIGVIDVRRIFGIGAVKPLQIINVVINIEPWKEGMLYDRLGVGNQYMDILGVRVPALTVPIKPGRNLAVIIEVAAMNNRQKKMGFNSAREFTEQINKHFDESLSGK